MNHRLFLFILTLALPVADTQGQNTNVTSFINCIELQNGTDNLLINGRPYSPSHPAANGHPYFQTKEWRPGIIYIKGNTYLADKLKYNLSTYQLIVKHQRPNGTLQKAVLSDLLVDSFRIEEHLFINRKLILSDDENGTYLEKIFTDKLSFYQLQKTVFNASFNNENPHGWFSNQKDVFYLLLNEGVHKITKPKQFLSCFPNHKTQIKKYMKTNKLKWKKMTKRQFSQLLKFCNDQI